MRGPRAASGTIEGRPKPVRVIGFSFLNTIVRAIRRSPPAAITLVRLGGYEAKAAHRRSTARVCVPPSCS